MPGPAGEKCYENAGQLCYYFTDTGQAVEGECRFRAPYKSQVTDHQKRPTAIVPKDYWCGDYRDINAPETAGRSARGSYIMPLNTQFSVTDAVNWVKFDPGNLYAGDSALNTSLLDGTLTVDIPGPHDENVIWGAQYTCYGGVIFPTASTNLEVTLGTGGVPYNADIILPMRVTPQMDGIELPFSMSGPAAVGAPQATIEVLMRGTIGTATFVSVNMGITVDQL